MRKANFLNGLLLVFLLAGCAAQQAYQDGQHLLDSGKAEEGLAQMEKALKLDPGNSEYRSQYFRRREIVVFQWLSQAETAKKNGAWDEAVDYYQRILKIDPDNPRARTALSNISTEKKQAQLLDEARVQLEKNDLAEAAKVVRTVLSESPSQPVALELRKAIESRAALAKQSSSSLKSKLARPITIEFKDAPIQMVFESISKSAGINFLFDKEVRPDLRTNLFVRDARIDDVIRFVLFTNQLDQRVLNSNTLFIYPNTPQKQKDFQELQIRNFFLTNANAKDIASMLKGMIRTNNINVDDKLNLITIRDTPSTIRVAERLIAAYDIAEPEVMLEVEVLEVGSNLLDTIGTLFVPEARVVKGVGQLGREGEAAVQAATGLSKNTNSFVVNGRTRIPDFISARDPITGLPTSLIESKNVQYQSLTQQLRDYRDLVGAGGRVDIALPPGARVSGPLQRAFDDPSNPLFRMDMLK
jgi:general secretion pathway protein D